MAEVAELTELYKELDLVKLAGRSDIALWAKAWRARDRWDARWQREYERLLAPRKTLDLEKVARLGIRNWARLLKAASDEPPPGAQARVEQGLIALGVTAPTATTAAERAYSSLGTSTAEDAGQFALDALRIDATFAWASPRDFATNLLAVRGSKIIQSAYGEHRSSLARMVLEKCNPSNPRTIGQLTADIRDEWARIAGWQARRIARTEAAAVWETTNYNALRHNGVEQVDWVVAHGPAIGRKMGPVCPVCLARAAQSPYDLSKMKSLPPQHPNCRCTLIPIYAADWLPPAEPWTGQEADFIHFPIEAAA